MPQTFKNELRESVDKELKFTNRLLLQFNFARADPYTIGFSRFACSNYQASTSGERLFNHCLTSLPVYFAPDDRLQFGWNETSIWRNAGVHMFEYGHLLLAAALGDCLPEGYAAAVLCALGALYEDADRVNPRIAGWQGLVYSITGLLTDTDFPLMIDDRQRLDPYRVSTGHTTSCTSALVHPTDFAKALKALFEVSTQGGRLVLVGGNLLGWFAAFAEMFLKVDVEVASRDGDLLHNHRNGGNASMRLIFIEDVSNISPTIKTQDSTSQILPLISGFDDKTKEIPMLPFTGRVAWEAVLPKVFGNAFHLLAHQESKLLVQSMGGAARMFALAAENPKSPEALLPDFISQESKDNKASHGLGLIQTIMNWFPELRHLQGRLERLQTLTVAETSVKCESGAQGLINICGCTICAAPHYSKYDSGKLPQSFCLLAVMETILNLGIAMSRITVVPRVYPSRAGILSIYQRQVAKLLSVKYETGKKDGNRIKVLFGNDWNANYSKRLQIATAIFSGSLPTTDVPENLVALSHEGICTYVTSIQKGSVRKEDAGLIRIQAGNISWNQKTYNRACLGSPEGISQNDYSWEAAPCKHMSEGLYLK